jgi:hypothetical protein
MSPFLTRIAHNKGFGSRVYRSAPASALSATLVYDLDAANYAAVPTNGSTVNGYTLTVSNAGGSISWNSGNGGYFSKSNNVATDVIYGGPNYVTGQSYTVFMAYQLTATSSGRILNTQSEYPKDWFMGGYNLNSFAFYPNIIVNIPSKLPNTAWCLDFATWNTTTNEGTVYGSTIFLGDNIVATASGADGGGFNQLRLFSRAIFSGSEVQTGNIAFVKVYNGVLTLSELQSLHTTYKGRFGY